MKYEFFKSPVHGIGARACVNILKDEIISSEPFLIIPPTTGILKDYIWSMGLVGGQNPKSTIPNYLLIQGLGMWTNHSSNPNVEPVKLKEYNSSRFIEFKALRDINKGEELLVYYGASYFLVRKTKGKKKRIIKSTSRKLGSFNFIN